MHNSVLARFLLSLPVFFVLSVQANEPGLSHEKYTLKNGMEVILQPDPLNAFVAVSVWYHVGAINEIVGKTGFAHLFEHLMFEGSKNVGPNHFKYLEEAGKTFLNGSTSFDRTNYVEVLPAYQLPLALWLESDRMGFLLDTMTQAMLDKQRGVVKNERRQNYENREYGMVTEKAWHQLLPPSHPYYGMVIGSMADLDAASLEDVKAFFKTYYTPSNATLTLVGGFDVGTAKELIEHYFANLASRPKPQKLMLSPVELKEDKVLHETEEYGKLAMVQLQYISPPLFAPGDAELDILSSVLTGDRSSLLTKALQFDEQLVQSVSASQQSMGALSVFTISALVTPGVKAEVVLQKIKDLIAQIKKTPPDRTTIVKAQNLLKTQKLLSLEKIGGFSGRAEILQSYNHYSGTPDYLTQDMARYAQVSPEDIQAAAIRYLDKSVTLIAEPKASK